MYAAIYRQYKDNRPVVYGYRCGRLPRAANGRALPAKYPAAMASAMAARLNRLAWAHAGVNPSPWFYAPVAV